MFRKAHSRSRSNVRNQISLSVTRGLRARRGVALFVALFFVAGVGALALSAIYLTATSTLLGKTYDKEDDLKYAVEAVLAMGKADVNYNPSALPLTGYDTLMLNASIKTADGSTVPGLTVTLYGGPTGSTSGQFGRFSSLVAVAKDLNGTGFVRRLELSQESFAKYAYWTNSEGSGISFGGGDQIWGPVWSNDTIDILSSGASFHDAVGTAGIITGAGNGTFSKGYAIKQKPIALPSTSSLSTLSSLATLGGLNITGKTTGSETGLEQRIEFIPIDMLGTHDSTADNDGFFRVYQLDHTTSADIDWLRGDWPESWGTAATSDEMYECGDWHPVVGSTDQKFFPLSAHYHPNSNWTWFDTLMAKNSGTVNSTSLNAAKTEATSSVQTLMQHSGARCYLGGDPHLVAVARTNALGYSDDKIHKGGDDTTFTPTDPHGHWVQYSATPLTQITTVRPNDAKYLFPLYRGYNTGTKGVIYVGGTVGVSGTVRGSVTLYSPYTVVILDDIQYVTDPAKGLCVDILGIVAGNNVVVADNAINTPQNIKSSGSKLVKSLDDTQDLTIQSVIMALNTSFGVENYGAGPAGYMSCDANSDGRGCLRLTGGVIQKTRGAVGTSAGYGYTKRYTYDRCAVINPPPYFPTTGRYGENRYYELDPVKFDPAKTFQQLTPSP
jgi:hypothetical protein